MKLTTRSSFSSSERRVLAAASLAMLLGAVTAVAQSTTSSGSSSSTTPRASGSYGSSSTGSTATGTATPSTPNTSPDNTPRADGSYGSGGTGASASSSATTSDTTRASRDTAVTTQVGQTDTAGGATTMTGRDSGKLGWMERRWVNKVADSGSTELALAKLATEKASNAEVKSYAQKLIDDHTQVSDELKALASQKNVKLDDEDLGSDRAHKRLSKKSGMDFDQEFVEHMIDMHEADIKLFEKASTDAKDPALRSFAAKHVDHLRQHLQQAQSLRSSIVPTGRMNDASPSRSSTDTPGAASGTSTSTDSTSRGAHPSATTPATDTSTGATSTPSGTDTTRRSGSR